jgi:hypothetical protein
MSGRGACAGTEHSSKTSLRGGTCARIASSKAARRGVTGAANARAGCAAAADGVVVLVLDAPQFTTPDRAVEAAA